MANEPQPQGVCELQGRRIKAPGLPALVLTVNARRWVLADNTFWHARWDLLRQQRQLPLLGCGRETRSRTKS
jgi:hypothetical protein